MRSYESVFVSPSLAWKIRLGGLMIAPIVQNFTVSNSLNNRPTASMQIEKTSALVGRLDFSNALHVYRGETPDDGEPLFTGSITSVDDAGDRLIVECLGMAEFSDRAVGEVVARNANLDMIYALAREAGMSDERIKIQGYSLRNRELFEVVVPLSGLTQSETQRVGGTSVVGSEAARRVLAGFARDELTDRFLESRSYAVCYVSSETLYEAQEKGLENIDFFLGWLAVRTHYSSALSPSGQFVKWDRDRTRVRVSRTELAAVRGLLTGRAWLRRTDSVLRKTPLEVGTYARDEMANDFTGSEEDSLRQAVLAFGRAVSNHDPVVRVVELWNSIEFYVGGARAPKIFAKSDKVQLNRAVEGLFRGPTEKRKRQRLNDVLGSLNNAPLGARFRAKIAVECVPVSNREVDLLWRLREVRNDVSHGRVYDSEKAAELATGLAIMARILVYALHYQSRPNSD